MEEEWPCPYCHGVREATFLTSKGVRKHVQKFHGKGIKKIQCLDCGTDIWWPEKWYRLHCHSSNHGNSQVSHADIIIDHNFHEREGKTQEKGIQGRANKVYFSHDEERLTVISPYFPFLNATETMFYLWEHCCQPTQECSRMLRSIIRHPKFSVSDFPSEKEITEMTASLPLLPMYEVQVEGQDRPILMHSIIDWIQQLENNPTLQAKMHWEAEFVSYKNILVQNG
jgi:hypothetical protein